MNYVASTALNRMTVQPSRQLSAQALRLAIYATEGVCDFVAILSGFLIADMLYHRSLQPSSDWLQGVGIAVLFGIIAIYGRAYGASLLGNRLRNAFQPLKILGITVATVVLVAFSLKGSAELSRLVLALGTLLSGGLIVTERLLVSHYVKTRFKGRLQSHVLVRDGIDVDVPEGVRVIDADRAGLTPDMNDPMMLHLIGFLLRGADRVTIASTPERRPLWAMVLKGSNLNGEVLVPEIDELEPIRGGSFADIPAVPVSCGVLDMPNRILKRSLDLAVTVPVLILIAPLLAFVALAIRLESSGPILFVQTRMGRGNRLFNTYKFRSMRADQCDANGTRSASRDDDRITKVGRFIRATSIDELPQLFNVLLGDMSLVGPRPHALGSLAGDQLFWEVDGRYWHRHACKPGITGLAQVKGFRGATHKRSDLTDRLQADLDYLEGWSIWRDIKILLATAKVVTHKNAF